MKPGQLFICTGGSYPSEQRKDGYPWAAWFNPNTLNHEAGLIRKGDILIYIDTTDSTGFSDIDYFVRFLTKLGPVYVVSKIATKLMPL